MSLLALLLPGVRMGGGGTTPTPSPDLVINLYWSDTNTICGDFVVIQGEAVQINFNPVTSTDITGWDVHFLIGGGRAYSFDLEPTFVDASVGTMKVTLTSDQTLLRYKSYVWRLVRTDAPGTAPLAVGYMSMGESWKVKVE